MTKKMIKLATKIFKLLGKYLEEYEKDIGVNNGFIYIKHENGEIVIFAESVEKAKEEIKFLKAKE